MKSLHLQMIRKFCVDVALSLLVAGGVAAVTAATAAVTVCVEAQ